MLRTLFTSFRRAQPTLLEADTLRPYRQWRVFLAIAGAINKLCGLLKEGKQVF